MDFTPYLKAFETAAKEARETYKLTGDRLLVATLTEEYSKEVKTKSGLILPKTTGQVNNMSANLPTMAIVLMVGEGYYDDTKEGGEDVPCETKVGDIILVGQNSIISFSQFGNISAHGKNEAQIGLCFESSVQMRWHGQEAYDKFFDVLSRALKE